MTRLAKLLTAALIIGAPIWTSWLYYLATGQALRFS